MKKLTKQDIPEGYNYAAVDPNGNAYAFQYEPNLMTDYWGMDLPAPSLIGEGFDASDWEKSMVSNKGEIKSTTSIIVNRFISLSPDAFSMQIVDKESNFYTFKKDDYSFYIQHYFKTDDDGFNATEITFKGDDRIGRVDGDIETVFTVIESTILNKNEKIN
jgi:hypothetical protein